jgi:hypothetical protein
MEEVTSETSVNFYHAFRRNITGDCCKRVISLFRAVFWVVLPCRMIVVRRFRGAYCLHHQGCVQPRRQLWTSYSPPWELEISHRYILVPINAQPLSIECCWTLLNDSTLWMTKSLMRIRHKNYTPPPRELRDGEVQQQLMMMMMCSWAQHGESCAEDMWTGSCSLRKVDVTDEMLVPLLIRTFTGSLELFLWWRALSFEWCHVSTWRSLNREQKKLPQHMNVKETRRELSSVKSVKNIWRIFITLKCVFLCYGSRFSGMLTRTDCVLNVRDLVLGRVSGI